MMKEKGAIWKLDSNDDDDIPFNGAANGTNGTNDANGINNCINPAPALKDVIGAALKYVGTYKNLDNKKQVVALIDDVIIYCLLLNFDVKAKSTFFFLTFF